MQSAAKAIKDGGLLVVTFEPYKAAGGFGLSSETSRFGHTSASLSRWAMPQR
jgi:predicted TPR repeat methyltransferase